MRSNDREGPTESDMRETTAEGGGRDARDTPLRLTGSRYEPGPPIGEGGMGEVLAARDHQLGRDVAIKRMRTKDPSERAIARFLREARIQARLDHPAIVPVHELGRDRDGRPFFAMKKLTGTTLRQIIDLKDSEPRARQRLLRAFVDMCLAIEFAHTRGVVHRDLKPENVVLGDFGEVYVLDWGVAKILGEEDGDFGELSSGDADATRVGVVVGTRGYMAPEQERGDADVDARVDIYALGCVLFEILAGARATAPDSRPAQAAGGRDIPPELDELCARACAADRSTRIATARELGELVQEYLDGDRDVERRRQLARASLDSARAALARGDEAGRTSALRDAGRALALDPTTAEAAGLLAQLMLEPPREVPREVEDALHVDLLALGRKMAVTVKWGYIGYAVLVPSMVTAFPLSGSIALLAAVALNFLLISRVEKVYEPSWMGLVIANAALMFVLSWMMSPLVTVGLAAIGVMNLGLMPTDIGPRQVAVLAATHLLALFAPWLSKIVGWHVFSIAASSGTLVVHAPGFGGPLDVPVLVLGAVAVIAIAATASFVAMRADCDMRRRLHLQAWQLRQLVA